MTVSPAGRQAAFYYNMLNDPTWIERRVETVRFIDETRYLRNVQVDIDLQIVDELCVKLNLKQDVVLPLEFIPRGLVEKLKVRDRSGSRLRVALSEEVNQVWCDALVACAWIVLKTSPPSWLADEIVSFIEKTDRLLTSSEVMEPQRKTTLRRIQSEVSCTHYDDWKTLIEDDLFFDMLKTALSTSFVGVRVVAGKPGRGDLRYGRN